MKTNQVGRTKVSVTALGFGGAPIGNLFSPVSDEDAWGAINSAWEGGVRYFDTAPHYGLGLSERRLGAALLGKNRNQFVVSTKVGRLITPNPSPSGSDLPNGYAVGDDFIRTIDYSSDGVKRSIDESLGRLEMDYVDIVYVHDPDNHVDQVICETIPALIRLRDEGVIGAIGAGMNSWQPLLRFAETCDIDVVMLAGRWTLLDRTGQPLLDACASRNVSAIAAGPFNSGILSRALPISVDHFDYQSVSPELFARVSALADICANHGIELPQAAINFPLRNSAVAAVAVGVRNAVEVETDVGLMGRVIPGELWDEVDGFERGRGEF